MKTIALKELEIHLGMDNQIISNGELRWPLFHGTNSMWLQSIAEKGLGSAFPFHERALQALRVLYERTHPQDKDYTTEKIISQSTGAWNWQHGQVYFSLSFSDAWRYAQNKLGSELLSECLAYRRKEIERLGFEGALDSNMAWLDELSAQAGTPVVIAALNMPAQELDREREGGSLADDIFWIEEQREEAARKFDELEAAREALRMGDASKIDLVLQHKGQNDRSLFMRESLKPLILQRTYRLRSGSSVPLSRLAIVCRGS